MHLAVWVFKLCSKGSYKARKATLVPALSSGSKTRRGSLYLRCSGGFGRQAAAIIFTGHQVRLEAPE